MKIVGVAAAVPALVVVADAGKGSGELGCLADDDFAQCGVCLHDPPLFRVQPARLFQNGVGDADLADIVEGASHLDESDLILGHADTPGQNDGVVGDAL